MATEKRNDIHRRGAFEPDKYTFFGWYWFGIQERDAAGKPTGKSTVGAVGGDIEKYLTGTDEFGIPILDYKAMVYGDFGKCGVCGARFACGEVWRHGDTNDLVHLGCDCCEKYNLVSGTDWDAKQDERRRAALARKTAAKRSAQREKLFKAYPGIEEAFKIDHYIVRDILRRFEGGTVLSDGQINLVFKIAAEHKEREAKRAAQQTERHVPVPVAEGRQTVRGVVVSKKLHDSPWGEQVKVTVKVETPEGSWLVWGTLPTLTDAAGQYITAEKGDTIEFDAKLVKGERDPHFGFFKRPTKASIISRAQVAA